MYNKERSLDQWALEHGRPELVTPHQFSIVVDDPHVLFLDLEARLHSLRKGASEEYPLASCYLDVTTDGDTSRLTNPRISLSPEKRISMYVDMFYMLFMPTPLNTTIFNHMLQPYGRYITRDTDGSENWLIASMETTKPTHKVRQMRAGSTFRTNILLETAQPVMKNRATFEREIESFAQVGRLFVNTFYQNIGEASPAVTMRIK